MEDDTPVDDVDMDIFTEFVDVEDFETGGFEFPGAIDKQVDVLSDYQLGKVEHFPQDAAIAITDYVINLNIPKESETHDMMEKFMDLTPKTPEEVGEFIHDLVILLKAYYHHEPTVSTHHEDVIDYDSLSIDELGKQLDVGIILVELKKQNLVSQHLMDLFVSNAIIPWVKNINKKHRHKHPLDGNDVVHLLMKHLGAGGVSQYHGFFSKDSLDRLVMLVDVDLTGLKQEAPKPQQPDYLPASPHNPYKQAVKRFIEEGKFDKAFISKLKFGEPHEFFTAVRNAWRKLNPGKSFSKTSPLFDEFEKTLQEQDKRNDVERVPKTRDDIARYAKDVAKNKKFSILMLQNVTKPNEFWKIVRDNYSGDKNSKEYKQFHKDLLKALMRVKHIDKEEEKKSQSQLDKEEENRQVKLQQKKIAYAKKREKLQQDLNIWTAKRQNANKGSTQWEQADEMVQRIAAKLGVKPKDFMVVYKDDTPPITPHKADKAACSHCVEPLLAF